MLVTALSTRYWLRQGVEDRALRAGNDLTLKEAALKLGFVTEGEFDRVVDPAKMVRPYVAKASWFDLFGAPPRPSAL